MCVLQPQRDRARNRYKRLQGNPPKSGHLKKPRAKGDVKKTGECCDLKGGVSPSARCGTTPSKRNAALREEAGKQPQLPTLRAGAGQTLWEKNEGRGRLPLTVETHCQATALGAGPHEDKDQQTSNRGVPSAPLGLMTAVPPQCQGAIS